MNRIWDEPRDDEPDEEGLVKRTSEHHVRIRTNSEITDRSPLMLGACPIVIDSPETALAGSQWGYEQAKQQLMERGLPEDEAHEIAEGFRKKQYQEMLATVVSLEQKAGPASWN